MHQPESFTVPLRVWHPEVAFEIFLGVSPLLMTDDHDRHAADAGPPAHNGRIVPEVTIAVQLDEISENRAQVVERVGATRMSGHLDPLDRSEVLVDVFAQRHELGVELLEILGDVDIALAADPLEVVDLPLQLEQRFLEFQRVRGGHGYSAFT